MVLEPERDRRHEALVVLEADLVPDDGRILSGRGLDDRSDAEALRSQDGICDVSPTSTAAYSPIAAAAETNRTWGAPKRGIILHRLRCTCRDIVAVDARRIVEREAALSPALADTPS